LFLFEDRSAVLAAFATDLMFVHLNGLHFSIANGQLFLTRKGEADLRGTNAPQRAAWRLN
jgi:hypothetical protein